MASLNLHRIKTITIHRTEYDDFCVTQIIVTDEDDTKFEIDLYSDQEVKIKKTKYRRLHN